MSKSTGIFLPMKEVIKTYGADATRFAMADAGDSIEDANFSKKLANNAILKIFALGEWIEKVCDKTPI